MNTHACIIVTTYNTSYIEKTVIAIPFKHYIGNKFAKT